MRVAPGYIPLFDNGHPGWVYNLQTKQMEYTPLATGKQYKHGDHRVIYEGVYNRKIVNDLMWELYKRNIPYAHLVPELTDIPLNTRVVRADNIYKYNKKVYICSIHGNGGKGRGIEGWTSKGQTGSDIILDYILSQFEVRFSHITRMRFDMSDNDRDKEKNYTMVYKPRAFSFILELGFMDTLSEYFWMMNEATQKLIITILADCIEYIYINGLD